ncbi:MAG: hypothetical protein KDC79_11665 [Cyclobacteriaceae bacterium]|nr:hypothetical protein [Cyclobacteriaceae bacterium]
MKKLLVVPALFVSSLLWAQDLTTVQSGEKVIVDNDKIKVVEFTSNPLGDVCGKGMHHHEPHLAILITDAKAKVTAANGESHKVTVPSGASFWIGDEETHSAINTGTQPTKMILVYLKE